MVARQVQDVDLLEVGGQVAVHQGVQLADGQAILELVAIVGPLARAVNLAAGVIAVGQDPEDWERESRGQRVVAPFDHRIHVSLGAAARDREVVFLQPADLLGSHHLVMVAVAQVQDDVLGNFRLAAEVHGGRQRRKRLDPLLHLGSDGFEQPGDLRPGLDLLPFAVPLFGQVDDLGFQLQDLLVGRVVVRDVLVLTASPPGRRRLAARPLYVFVEPARGDVRHHRAANVELPADLGLLRAIGDGRLDVLDLLLGQLHGGSLSVEGPGARVGRLGIQGVTERAKRPGGAAPSPPGSSAVGHRRRR